MRVIGAVLVISIALSGMALADDHGDSPLAATPVAVGSGLLSACIEAGGDMDYFFFQAAAGRTYLLLTSHLDEGTDTVLYLFDTDGSTILRVDDDGGTGGGSRVEWAPLSAGTYFVMVRHAQATTGTGCYSLSASTLQVDDHGNDSLTATPLLVGGSAPGFLETADDVDVFLFSVESGYSYAIELEKTSGDGTAHLDFLGETANDILAAAITNGGPARVTWEATASGVRFLAVRSEGGTGGYRLSVDQSGYVDDFANSAATAVDLNALGLTARGRIEVAGDTDWLRFRAREGGAYRFVVGAAGPIRTALVGLDGETVLEETSTIGGNGLEIEWIAPSDGVYFLEISSTAGSVSYTLRLDATLQLELLGQFNPRGYSFDVVADGSFAYLIVGAQGLLVVDVSNPALPVEVGSHSTRGYAQAITLEGDHAFVANRSDGLTVLDVSDPMRPVEVGHLDTPGSAWDVAVEADRAFVADSQGGLHVIDVGRSGDPSSVAAHATSAFAKSIWIANSVAYVAMGDAGLELIDISDPENPATLSLIKTFGEANGVAVADGIAFVAAGYGGIRIIDVSDPTAPVEIGFISTAGEAMGIALAGGILYVAEATDGLSVYSVADPMNPQRAAQIDTPGEATSVYIDDGRAYVADREEGLQIVELLQ
ncbi:MAG: pre-peptidase C-terminal domain-containing protein [Candidatus Bipolaricaulia bacterium]